MMDYICRDTYEYHFNNIKFAMFSSPLVPSSSFLECSLELCIISLRTWNTEHTQTHTNAVTWQDFSYIRF